MNDAQNRNNRHLWFGLFGVICAVMVGRPVIESLRVPTHPAEVLTIKLPTVQEKIPPSPNQLAAPHLDRADQECEQSIEEYVDSVNAFFLDSKKNTRGFADEALSFGSKWRLMIDYVPFTKGGRHENFIKLKLQEYIFSPAQLEQVVKQAINGYLARVKSIESRMLVNLRTDASDFPATFVLAKLDDVMLQDEFNQAISKAIQATGSNLQGEAFTQLASIIVGEIFTHVAVKFGVSAGILGAGAASGWVTLGAGVVVGLIVDHMVAWVWDWYADPRGDLAKGLDRKIDEINKLITEGSGEMDGLRSRLTKFARDRSSLRREATLQLLQQGMTR